MAANTLRLTLVRHGETSWSLSGRHTGLTDIALTDRGRQQAAALAPFLNGKSFNVALTSPLSRARETARLAGFPDATVCDDLKELNYGQYEGLTSDDIRKMVPSWTIWTGSCPDGETLQQVAARAQRVIAGAAKIGGDVIVFSHGHFLRILASVWLIEAPTAGHTLMLDAASISVLAHEHDTPAIKLWNFLPREYPI